MILKHYSHVHILTSKLTHLLTPTAISHLITPTAISKIKASKWCWSVQSCSWRTNKTMRMLMCCSWAKNCLRTKLLIFFFNGQKWNQDNTIEGKKRRKARNLQKASFCCAWILKSKNSHHFSASSSTLLLSSLLSRVPSSNFLLNFSFLAQP